MTSALFITIYSGDYIINLILSYNLFPPSADDADYVIDLSWIKTAEEEPEKVRYLCRLCSTYGPDSVMIQQTDPSKLKFVPAGIIRYFCGRCGWTIDNTEENKHELRRQERVSTLIEDIKPGSTILDAVKSDTKDRLKTTAHGKVADLSVTIEPNEAEYLRADGVQIKKEVTRSSVTGHRTIKEYNNKHTGKRDREKA